MPRVRVQTVRATPRKVGLEVNAAVTRLEEQQCSVRTIHFLPPFEESPGRRVVYAHIVFEFADEPPDNGHVAPPVPGPTAAQDSPVTPTPKTRKMATT
jgi:hypothetical protein